MLLIFYLETVRTSRLGSEGVLITRKMEYEKSGTNGKTKFCVLKLTSYPNGHLVPVTDDCYFFNIPTKMTEINIIE